MTIVEFSITPIGKGESVSPWVSKAVDIIDRSGLKYQVGPLSTSIEGDWEDVCPVLGQCLREISQECSRILMSVRVDYRKDSARSMAEQVGAVARQLGHVVPSIVREG